MTGHLRAMPPPVLPDYADTLRSRDPDRLFMALLAPPDRRDALFLLYAFNDEIARAREVVSEPMLALIRLQWWREVVEGMSRRHALATPLSAALDQGRLDRATLLRMIAGREMEAEPGIATLADWRAYLMETAGAMAAGAALALGASPAEAARMAALGASYGVAGQLRNARRLARAGRCLLPQEVMARHGVIVEALTRDPALPALDAVLADLRATGREWFCGARGVVPRKLIAAALPGVLARRDLDRTGPPRAGLGTSDRIALLIAVLLRRV